VLQPAREQRKLPAPACQVRPIRAHQRKNPSAIGTTAKSSSSTIQYRAPEGSTTGNTPHPQPPDRLGCGKSFTVRSVVELAKARRAKITLVAPTGRAAKRLAGLTGHEAATIWTS
jgi:hypothetical protein